MAKQGLTAQDFLERSARDPLWWRRHLVVDGKMFGTMMSDVQEADFRTIDPALLHLAGMGPPADVVGLFRQRSRGYSKSSDIAMDLLWLYYFAPKFLQGMCVAADKDQADLVRSAMQQILWDNPKWTDALELQKKQLLNKHTGATLKFMTADVASSYGERPDIVVADELTHWGPSGEALWESVWSSYGKKRDKGAVILVACNAGWGRNWEWRVRSMFEDFDAYHLSAPAGASPWYSEEMLAEQRAALSPHAFSRLFENQWQDDSGGYVSLAEADACVDDSLSMRTVPDPQTAYYFGAIDYAEKNDRTVAVLGHVSGGITYIDRMDVVEPEKCVMGYCPVSWCEDWILAMRDRFGTGLDVRGRERMFGVIVDPHQLAGLYQRLTGQVIIERFNFAGGTGNYEIAQRLRQAIINQKVRWYPNCGALERKDGRRDDLSTELSQLVVKEMPNGRYRFDHQKSGFDDRAFALGALVWKATESMITQQQEMEAYG